MASSIWRFPIKIALVDVGPVQFPSYLAMATGHFKPRRELQAHQAQTLLQQEISMATRSSTWRSLRVMVAEEPRFQYSWATETGLSKTRWIIPQPSILPPLKQRISMATENSI